jgi:hypothetical protein
MRKSDLGYEMRDAGYTMRDVNVKYHWLQIRARSMWHFLPASRIPYLFSTFHDVPRHLHCRKGRTGNSPSSFNSNSECAGAGRDIFHADQARYVAVKHTSVDWFAIDKRPQLILIFLREFFHVLKTQINFFCVLIPINRCKCFRRIRSTHHDHTAECRTTCDDQVVMNLLYLLIYLIVFVRHPLILCDKISEISFR